MDADAFFREDAARQGMTASEYESAYGIQLTNGPAENRIRYHEVPAGLLAQEDLSLAVRNERGYTSERNRKRRRGYHPDGAILAPSTSNPSP